MSRLVFALAVFTFVCLVGIALAGAPAEPTAAAAGCHGEATACHGRMTVAQRIAARQTARQDARAAKRAAKASCHGE